MTRLKGNKKPANILVVNVPLYRMHVLVAFAMPIEKALQYANQRGCSMDDGFIRKRVSFADGANGLCTNLGYGNSDVLVWLKNRLCRTSKASEFGVLYHELYHAVDRIARSHNLTDEEEARAYVFEYLVTECNKFFWSKRT